MAAAAFISGFSLLEWLLVGFIGLNAGLSGVYVLHRGVKRFGGGRGD